MPQRDGIIELRVTATTNVVATVGAIRAATSLPLSDIKTAVTAHEPIVVAQLYGRDHDAVETKLVSLLDELRRLETKISIIIDGNVESREYLGNILGRWKKSGIETSMMSDIESGEPCMETLEWLKHEAPQDVFRQTLQQIAQSDGYNVDPPTMAWVKRQLNDAEQTDEREPE